MLSVTLLNRPYLISLQIVKSERHCEIMMLLLLEFRRLPYQSISSTILLLQKCSERRTTVESELYIDLIWGVLIYVFAL